MDIINCLKRYINATHLHKKIPLEIILTSTNINLKKKREVIMLECRLTRNKLKLIFMKEVLDY